jgi:hypothetical protein
VSANLSVVQVMVALVVVIEEAAMAERTGGVAG